MASTSFKAGVAVGATAAAGGGGYAINLAVNKDKGEQETINPEEKAKQDKKLTPEEIEAEAKKKEEKEKQRKQQEELEKKKKEDEAKKAEAAKKEAERIEIEGPSFSDLSSTEISYPDKTIGSVVNNKERLAAADLPSNEEWWKWAYRKRWETRENKEVALPSPFDNVNGAYKPLQENNVTGPKSLNQACHQAYKLKLRDFYLKDNLVNAISKFCIKKEGIGIGTPEGEKPGTISFLNDLENVDTNYANKLGIWRDNKNQLVSPLPKDPNTHKNEEWWIWSYQTNYKNAWPDPTDKFVGLTSAYSTSDGDTKALNQVCKSYYNSETSITDENIKGNIKEFCSKANDVSDLTFEKPK